MFPPTPDFPPSAPIRRSHAKTSPPPQKEKEELDDVSTELELADEDETIP